jgi:hypothetical protein
MQITRLRFLGAFLLLASACFVLYGCTPTAHSVVGTYAPNDNNDPTTLVIRDDGSFSQLDRGDEVGKGSWKINSAYHVFKSLELDGHYRLSLERSDASPARRSGSYGLVHKGGKLCIDVDQVLLTWCKVD